MKAKMIGVLLVVLALACLYFYAYTSGKSAGKTATYPRAFLCTALDEGQSMDCVQISPFK